MDKSLLFKVGVIGGTFSTFHNGHKHFILKALSFVDRLIIGVTSDEFVKKLEKAHPVEEFETRVSRLENFLKNQNVLDRCEIIKIDDFMGPAGTRVDIEAIIVTDETLASALEINLHRVRNNLKPLSIIVIEPLLNDDYTPISATLLWISRNFPPDDVNADVIPGDYPQAENEYTDNRSF